MTELVINLPQTTKKKRNLLVIMTELYALVLQKYNVHEGQDQNSRAQKT